MAADDRCELLCLDLDAAERLRASRLGTRQAEGAAARAAALGDPTRLVLACALREVEELCVCDLAWIAERPQNLVSHHLRLLKSRGLLACHREGKMVMYSITADGARLLDAVLAEEAALKR